MLFILFRWFSCLPLPVLQACGVVLGWGVYGLSPTYRTRLATNIQRAGYGGYLRAAIGEAGKNIAELPFIWCAAPSRVLKSATVKNWACVQAALSAQQGVIFLTPHLGCFEIIAQVLAANMPLTVLYRPPRKAMLKPIIEGARARANLKLAPANLSGVRTLLKALKNQGAIGLLPDQVPRHGEGVWAPFFGQPAYTMTLPGKLRQMTGAAMVLAFARRLPWGRGYEVEFIPFDPTPGTDSAQAQAHTLNSAMEHVIARCPAQYFWSYHRYKIPPGVQPPPRSNQP